MGKPTNPVLPQEIGKSMLNCAMCRKRISAFYGVNAVGGTCTGKCSRAYDNLPIERKHEMMCGACRKDISLWEDAHSVRGPEGVMFVHTECLNGKVPFKSLPPITEPPEVKHGQHHSDR